MNAIVTFVIWMFCVRHCMYQGSKRLIGTFSGFVLGACFGIIGVLMVRSSRRLLPNTPNALGIETDTGPFLQ